MIGILFIILISAGIISSFNEYHDDLAKRNFKSQQKMWEILKK